MVRDGCFLATLRADTTKALMSSRSSYFDRNACWDRQSNVHPMLARRLDLGGLRHVGYA
jgi:hypothetical protein